jgi:hypothetical protein
MFEAHVINGIKFVYRVTINGNTNRRIELVATYPDWND